MRALFNKQPRYESNVVSLDKGRLFCGLISSDCWN